MRTIMRLKIAFLVFANVLGNLPEDCYSMRNEASSKQRELDFEMYQGEKVLVRKGFNPDFSPESEEDGEEVKTLTPSPSSSPLQGETGEEQEALKFDRKRKMYFYGKNLSEIEKLPKQAKLLKKDKESSIFSLKNSEEGDNLSKEKTKKSWLKRRHLKKNQKNKESSNVNPQSLKSNTDNKGNKVKNFKR